MNSKLLYALVLSVLLIPSPSFAQTSGLIPLDPFNHYGKVSIVNVQVSEKEYYKVVHLNVQIQVNNLGLEDSAWFQSDSIKLVNENGKSYFPTIEECSADNPPTFLGPCGQAKTDCGRPQLSFGIQGTQGGIGNYHPCFRVEKEFNKFQVYYGYLDQYPKMIIDYRQIGSIDLNQVQNPIANAGSYAQNLATNASSYAKNLVNNTSSYAQNINMSQPKDFFTQFFDWLKSLFHF